MELNDVDIEVLSTLGKFKCEEDINAYNATTFNLPNLQEAGFDAKYDEDFNIEISKKKKDTKKYECLNLLQ